MSHSRFSLFEALPCDLQNKIYTYLPNEPLANRCVNHASNQARLHALFSDQSDNSLHLQKKLLNCWMHSDSCPVSPHYLKKYVINRKTFHTTPLHYQLSVFALYNKLRGRRSQSLTINDYVEELLSIEGIFNNNKAVNFFRETAALLSQVNRYQLIDTCLKQSSTTANINSLLAELAFYLTEDQILTILLSPDLLIKLEHVSSSPYCAAFSENIMGLARHLSDVNKVKMLIFYWHYFFQSNKTTENIFCLTCDVISSLSDIAVVVKTDYQDLLKKIVDEITKVLEHNIGQVSVELDAFSLLKAIFSSSNRDTVRQEIVSFFKRLTTKKSPELYPDSVYEVLWDNAVKTGDARKAIEVIHYFLRLTSLSWTREIEVGIVDWLIRCALVKSHHFINNTLNKIIIKIVDKNNLNRLIDLFLQMCQSSSRNDVLNDSFWRIFRSFLRHPSVNPKQRNDLLLAMLAEVNRGSHSLYFLLPINRLTVKETCVLFDSVLTKNLEEPSISLIDALCKISSMPLPFDLIGGFIKRLIDFLLNKKENDFPVSLENIYATIINLSKQFLDEEAFVQLFLFLKNPLFGNKKFILLQSFFESRYLPKYCDDIYVLLTDLLCQKPLNLNESIIKEFGRCIYVISTVNPHVLSGLLDFFIKHTDIDLFVRLSILKCVTEQPLGRSILLKCLHILHAADFSAQSDPMVRIRVNILKNLAEYSSLSRDNIQQFFNEANIMLYSTIEDDHIGGFDLIACLLKQADLPVCLQESISDLLFEGLHADSSEKVVAVLGALKVWHERGYSSSIMMNEAAEGKLLLLTGHAEEQVQSEAIYLINILPLKSKQPQFVNLMSIFLMAIQEEKGLMHAPSTSVVRQALYRGSGC